MKIGRLLLILLAVAAAGFLAFRGLRGPAPIPPPAPPAAVGDPGSTSPFWPSLTDSKPPSEPGAPFAPAAAPEPDEAEPPPGTPVAADADVSLVIPYRTGTKSRYRVREAQLSRDHGSGAEQWWQFVWTVATGVVDGDGTGPARIRFEVEKFRFQTTAPGRLIEFDSERPDKVLLADETLGLSRTMKPLMAICSMPVEIVVGRGGEITGVEGAEALHRKFLDVVDTFGAQAARDAIDAPTAESLTEKWGEVLFPPLGGGTLKAGATRDAKFRTTYYERWASVSAGRMRATHDDPGSFRVEFKGKPEIEELNREAKSSIALAVEKAFVASSADAHAASWRIDREAGRLTYARLGSKFQFWISRRTGVDAQGKPQYDPRFTDIERRTIVELLDK